MTLAPDLLTALGMTALSAWSLGWVMWLLGRQHWRQGLAQAVVSVLCFGTAYVCFGLESRMRSTGLQLASLLAISLGVSFFTLALQRFRQSSHPRRDRLTLALPAGITLVQAAWWLPEQLSVFNRMHAVVTIAQMLYILWLLRRMRSSTPGKGWVLINTAMVVQTLSLLPFLFMSSTAATMSLQDSTVLQQIGRWIGCMVMFLNMVVTSMGFLLMQRDRQAALDHHRAQLDSLSQLPLRQAFTAYMGQAIAQADANGTPLSVLVLDIDHFKRFNDHHGHLVGDRVIQLVAQVLRSHLRAADMAARYGGEEFVVALPNTSAAAAHTLAQRLCEAVRTTPLHLPSGSQLHTTVSIGVHCAQVDTKHRTWEAWVAAADAAMYQAKRSGRDRVVSSSPPAPT